MAAGDLCAYPAPPHASHSTPTSCPAFALALPPPPPRPPTHTLLCHPPPPPPTTTPLFSVLQTELLEWQLVTHWSHRNHTHFPSAFRAAVKTLLMASTLHPHTTTTPGSTPTTSVTTTSDPSSSSSSSSGSNGSSTDGQVLLRRLPGPVLEQVFATAALPQGAWATAQLPSYSQLAVALEARPGVPQEALGGFGLGWPDSSAKGGPMRPGGPPPAPQTALGGMQLGGMQG